MLYVIPFVVFAGLMAVSGKATGHPMAFLGVLYLGGIASAFVMIGLKIAGFPL